VTVKSAVVVYVTAVEPVTVATASNSPTSDIYRVSSSMEL